MCAAYRWRVVPPERFDVEMLTEGAQVTGTTGADPQDDVQHFEIAYEDDFDVDYFRKS